MANLGGRGVSAVKWSAVSAILRFTLQLGSQVVLARMLGPDAYGVFGLAFVVLTFAIFLSEFGFSMNLVQLEDLGEEDVRVIATWQLTQGLVVASVLLIGAPWMAGYFGEPRVESVIRWFALPALFVAIAGTSEGLLQRDLNYRTRGIIDVTGYVAGYVVTGMTLAWLGYGYWSLVGAWTVQMGWAAFWSYRARPYPLKPLWWSARARRLAGVGATAFVTNIVNWLLTNVDRVVIGRYLNTHAVGLYSVSYNIANAPNAMLLGSFQGVFLSTGAKLQDDPARLRAVYLEVLAAVAIFLGPAFVALAVMGRAIVELLYGQKWLDAGPVLSMLLAAMPWFVAWGVSTPMLWNTGRKHLEAALQMPVLLVSVPLLYWATGHGIMTVAMVAAGVFVARAVVVVTAVCRVLGMGLLELAPIALRAIALSLAVGLTVQGALALGLHWMAPAWLRVAMGAGAALAVAAAVLASRPVTLLGSQAAQFLTRFLPRLMPAPVARAAGSPT